MKSISTSMSTFTSKPENPLYQELLLEALSTLRRGSKGVSAVATRNWFNNTCDIDHDGVLRLINVNLRAMEENDFVERTTPMRWCLTANGRKARDNLRKTPAFKKWAKWIALEESEREDLLEEFEANKEARKAALVKKAKAAKKAAKKTPAKKESKGAAKKTPAKRAPAKKTPAKKADKPKTKKKAPAKKAGAKKTAAKKGKK
ncbi:hypothetical protein KIPB_000713 [Kipferlia bialata]|uniref:Uncharacterized protein n=1 Tax=Kipferlia bialata TaxID=797122 RepID=A0A9K3GDN2_9EUKA|nr:hypothetical protein KIPB_000713 [Kipferlia bialata]|eukprot:g713.t1